MKLVEVSNVSKTYKGISVLENVSMKVRESEIVLLTGPNGSGKTTLLRCIAGLEPIDSGTITVSQKSVGFVFQELFLWPHLTVLQHIVMPLMLVKKLKRTAAEQEALSKRDTFQSIGSIPVKRDNASSKFHQI